MVGHFRAAICSLVTAFGILVPLAAIAQDDTALFSTAVPPNVMLMVDNSLSMRNIVWHPRYDPSATYSCTAFEATRYYTYSSDTTMTVCGKTLTIRIDRQLSGATWFYGAYLNWLYSSASVGLETNIFSTNNGTFSACLGGGTYSLYGRARVTALQDILREVICQVNSAGAVRFGIAQFRAGSDPNGGYVRVPIQDYFRADGAPNTYTIEGVSQSHGDHLDDAIDDLTGESWTPLSETLFQVYTYFMSRAAAERPQGRDAKGADGIAGTADDGLPGVETGVVFPEYVYEPDYPNNGPYNGTGIPAVPGSPVQWDCQKNFVIVLTDGEPTRDDYDINSPTSTAAGFSSFKTDLIGDYHLDGENEEPGTFPGGGSWETSRYLDDVALFMQTNDFLPDQNRFPGNQVIDIYTVGFTTSPWANAVLSKAAANGNGKFYFSSDPEALAEDIIAAISDIIQKSQAFTAATVPATRTAFGGKFYNSLFVPSDETGYWEGHLKSWTIDGIGQVLDKNGQCALDDPTGNCYEGPFASGAQPWWDASEQVPAPSARKLIASRLNPGNSQPEAVAFTAANMTAAMMDVSAADISSFQYTGPAPAEPNALADMVVANGRGCKIGTGFGAQACALREDSTGSPHILGDIFHSNPVVVPRPLGFRNEPSYQAWAGETTNPAVGLRDRVIVAGANDGFFRAFHAGDWNPSPPVGPPDYTSGTGAELAGFAPYTARRNFKNMERDSGVRDQYMTDGSPAVADVWMYTSPTLTGPLDKATNEWATVAVAGMRQGGAQYFALDITNPASASYPGYLWEFPREDAPATLSSRMGESWSEPVITKVRLAVNGDDNNGEGHERWVAIFAGGYAPSGDPNKHASYDMHATAGRAIFMVDIKTGGLIAQKAFVDTPAATDPTLVAYDPANPERSMLYAMPSTPGVFDLDFDGYSDVVYVGDLGGNVFKWVIKPVGHDPVNSASSDTSQPNWPFEKFFAAPVYNSGTAKYFKSFFQHPSATLKSGTLWLAFGSGERANLDFAGFAATPDENNRFYAVKDLDPLSKLPAAAPLVMNESTLLDITGDDSCADVGANSGFYFRGVDGEKFVTATDILFYYVFVASFMPTVNASPCLSGGEATLYAFKVHCGEGLFDDPAGDPVSSIALGDGFPTDPKVSLSSEDGGSRVFINKKDEVLNKDTGFKLGEESGQAYWREVNQ